MYIFVLFDIFRGHYTQSIKIINLNTTNNKEIASYSINHPVLGIGEGNNGCFSIPCQSFILTVIASDEGGWDHVSVSLKTRTPRYHEMCFIKELFFKEEETAVEFHVPQSKHINNFEYCLHLWRNQREGHKLPP